MKYSATIQYEVNKYLLVLPPTKFMPCYKRNELRYRKCSRRNCESTSSRIRRPINENPDIWQLAHRVPEYIEYQSTASTRVPILSGTYFTSIQHTCLCAGEGTLDRVLRRILSRGVQHEHLYNTRARDGETIAMSSLLIGPTNRHYNMLHV